MQKRVICIIFCGDASNWYEKRRNAGLKYSDIDKKQKLIHVQRTLKYIEGKGYMEDTPKTRTSARDIPLTAATLEHIEAQRKYWGFKVVRMDQYLFCNEEGEPVSRNGYRQRLTEQ